MIVRLFQIGALGFTVLAYCVSGFGRRWRGLGFLGVLGLGFRVSGLTGLGLRVRGFRVFRE